MNNVSMINPLQFLTLSLKLGIEACRIVKHSYNNKNVKHYFKAVDDPVTEADFKIQSMLIKGFKMKYPNLRIIGEEEKEYEGVMETVYDKLDSLELPNKIDGVKQYETSQCCLWIDPIDNTRGFIEGEAEAVTTLIGMSYKRKAQLGVIGIPFKKNKDKLYYNPSLLFGSVSGGFAYEYYPKENRWIQLKNQKTLRDKARIVMSPFRENIVEHKILEQLKGERLLAGGSGHKIAMVAKKQAQIMAYSLSHTQKWDTCAGEAIVKGLKGFCTTQFGQQIIYDHSKPKQLNLNGVICSLSEQLLNSSIKVCQDYKQQNSK